jgi:hypothetical protein
MSEEISRRARADFSKARRKAFFKSLIAAISGQHHSTLLSYDEIKEKLHIGGPVYRGVKTIRVEQIVGSLNRYHEFDDAFLPMDDQLASRWQSVDQAFYQDINLPPVVLYKVGEIYFVVDGHHRVSVAREQGQEFIDAEVRECYTRVNITPNIKTEDLEILHDKVNFLERTKFDDLYPGVSIKLTIPDGFDRMLEHIAVHRYFMGLEQKHHIDEDEAVRHWYETVYTPIIKVIHESNILKEFPDKTEGDLYLWVLDHQRYLYEEEGKPLQPPDEAARLFVEEQDS